LTADHPVRMCRCLSRFVASPASYELLRLVRLRRRRLRRLRRLRPLLVFEFVLLLLPLAIDR
jgi:hypothetical protein